MRTPERRPRPKASDDSMLDAPVGVRQITVDALFGQFDYVLRSETTDLSDLFILYGDNGSGKTTILKLLFHCLSAGRNRGHRSAIKHIPFKRFEVCLIDDTRIQLTRNETITGPYDILLQNKDRATIQVSFGTLDDRPTQFATAEQEDHFTKFMESLGLTVYILSADRRIESDIFPRDDDDEPEQLALWRMSEEAIIRRSRSRHRSNRGPDDQSRAVLQAMDLASSWIRSQLLQAANKGTSSSHGIYRDILKHILNAQPQETQVNRTDQVIETLRSLAQRTSEYARFGFIPPLSVDDMIDAVSHATPTTISIIENVLTPYIRGTEARLKELENIHALTEQFIHNLNSFYVLKKVDFELRKGLTVRLQDNSALNPAWLSSGEKHLLLLFCHVLVSNDKRSIFIIDEPELSLNIKWQRKLINALLQIIGNSRVQFILATHAIELLAEHDDHVVKLMPTVHAGQVGKDTQEASHESVDNS